jgi:tRNA (guanine-N7-)-methyltransferase
MTQLGRHSRPFQVRCTQPVCFPELNPFLRKYEEFGSPVVRSEVAVGARGSWARQFAQEQSLHLEIGSGNGFFLAGIAQVHPEWNVLGVEIRFKRIVTAAKKIRAFGVEKNARIVRYDAWWLDEILAPGELSGLYLNYPDPWPKEKHTRNRLLCPFFAQWAALALRPGSELRLKTDSLLNFSQMESAIADQPFEILAQVEDMGRNGVPWPEQEEIVTNFQRKFERKGLPVHGMVLRRCEH